MPAIGAEADFSLVLACAVTHLDDELCGRPLVRDVGDAVQDEAHDGDQAQLQRNATQHLTFARGNTVKVSAWSSFGHIQAMLHTAAFTQCINKCITVGIGNVSFFISSSSQTNLRAQL